MPLPTYDFRSLRQSTSSQPQCGVTVDAAHDNADDCSTTPAWAVALICLGFTLALVLAVLLGLLYWRYSQLRRNVLLISDSYETIPPPADDESSNNVNDKQTASGFVNQAALLDCGYIDRPVRQACSVAQTHCYLIPMRTTTDQHAEVPHTTDQQAEVSYTTNQQTEVPRTTEQGHGLASQLVMSQMSALRKQEPIPVEPLPAPVEQVHAAV